MRKIFLPLLLFANIAFGQVNLNLGLKAYYPFSGNANDISGNNNNPVFNNATLTADRLGNPNSAYHFDGAGIYMKIPNSPTINFGNSMSIALWVKPMGFYTGTCHNNMIIMKGTSDQQTNNYSIRFTPDPFQGCVSNPDLTKETFWGPDAFSPNPFIQLNRWYSVIWTTDGVTAKIYIDCVLKGSSTSTVSSFSNAFDLTFGKLENASFPYWLNGDLDEVRIYNRALNQDEVNALGGCAVSGTPISNIINDYTPVQAFNICQNKLNVEDATKFNTGDTVLMIQMKGAIIDSTNSTNFGTVTDYKNAGNYEFNYVKSKAGNIIELKNALTRQYDIPTGKVQLIRVPYYTSVNVSATLTCLPWDGSKGGVLALNVRDTVNLTADIDVSGRGLRGGVNSNIAVSVLACNQANYYYDSTSSQTARKGEGIAVISSTKLNGRGKLGNGGGGGNGHNAGGGGGSNASAGGFGGYQLNNCGGAPFDNRGIGGQALLYNNTVNKIFLGGGGGAGHYDGPIGSGHYSNGGNGGGIVLINAGNLISNNHIISAKGITGEDCVQSAFPCNHDGMAGGGAGGSVVLGINTFIDNIVQNVNGGKGANLEIYTAAAGKVGPGGGGSGGIVWFKSGALPANSIVQNTGGANGVIVNAGNDPWGATPGSTGVNLFNLVVPVDNIPFKPNIDSVRIKDSVLICTSFDFKGLTYTNTYPANNWQWTFGDGGTANTQNTTHTYTASGTYNVKLIVTDINGCKDSISKNVTVSIFNADAGSDTAICTNNAASVKLNASQGSSYVWTPAALLNNANIQSPTATVTSTTRFYVTITNQVGCVATDSVTVTIAPPVPNIRYQTITAFANQPVQLQARNLGGNSYVWMPATGLNNNLIINPIFNYSQSQEFKINIKNALGCNITDTLLITLKGKKGIYVPKAFSPNSNGVNDRLYPILVGINKLNYFRVYNRWGNLVFETNTDNPAAGWNGTIHGNPQPPETYTWVVEGVDIDGIVIKQSGNTFLIR